MIYQPNPKPYVDLNYDHCSDCHDDGYMWNGAHSIACPKCLHEGRMIGEGNVRWYWDTVIKYLPDSLGK